MEERFPSIFLSERGFKPILGFNGLQVVYFQRRHRRETGKHLSSAMLYLLGRSKDAESTGL